MGKEEVTDTQSMNYSAIKKNKNVCHLQQHGCTWENIMLRKQVRQRNTNIVCYNLYVEPKKYNKLMNIAKKQQTHRHRTNQWLAVLGERRGEVKYRSRGLRGTNYHVKTKLHRYTV